MLADFEAGYPVGWATTGEAFGKSPAMGSLLTKLEIENASGQGVASSETEGDGPQGTLTSPEFKIERRYLSFLIGGGDYEHSTCLELLIDGKVVRSATGRNSDRLASASWDLAAFSGRMATIRLADRASGRWGHLNVDRICQTDHPEQLPVVATALYQESLRPQFHFTARQWTTDRLSPGMRQEGWVNDLNGLIYYEGDYHLFAQRWNKCWIHAVSRDLVHWQELEPAFWEETLDSGVQSGTCVIDYQNTSRLSNDPAKPPMVAFWSRNDNRSQCLSYSLDHGRTWKHYDKNPILDFPERDPKVFWHEPTKRWVMMLYGADRYHVLTSTNLLDWRDEKQTVPHSFECPDLFELPVDGDPAKKKWVLVRGDGKYSTGTFDGTAFKEESAQLPCDVGPNFYATQTWENTSTGDGRRVQVAWMRGGKYPDMPFNQQISFPCELTLRTTPSGLRLFREPVREISKLHEQPRSWSKLAIAPGASVELAESGDLFHLTSMVSIPEGGKLVFQVRGLPIALSSKALFAGGKTFPVSGPVSSVEILIDRTSVEVFLNHGELSYSTTFLPRENGLSLTAEGATAMIGSMELHAMRSAWVTD